MIKRGTLQACNLKCSIKKACFLFRANSTYSVWARGSPPPSPRLAMPRERIKRTKLIEIVESFLGNDEVRIIRKLHSNTILDITSISIISNPFETNISSLQGHGLSGCLFIKYLEKALRTRSDRVDIIHVSGNRRASRIFRGQGSKP